jgi:hypothetical protein
MYSYRQNFNATCSFCKSILDRFVIRRKATGIRYLQNAFESMEAKYI